MAAFFERRGSPYAVIGALALHAYGLSRGTFDLDLVAPAAAQPDLLALLESLGYETLHRSAGYSNHLHPRGALGRVDVVYVGGETSDRSSGSAGPWPFRAGGPSRCRAPSTWRR